MFQTHPRKPPIILTLLLLFNFLLLSVQIRSEKGELLLTRIGIAAITPLVYAEHFFFGSISDLIDQYIYLVSLKKENLRLEEENMRLMAELNQLKGLKALAEREYLSAITEPLLFNYVSGSIIHKNMHLFSDTVIINQGTLSGIAPNQPVISGEGLVGRVIASNPLTSEVELIIDPLASAGALLEDSRIQCLVRGTASPNLSLEFVSISDKVRIGEMVYTSGTDDIYPKEIPIGRIISASDGRVYQEIEVAPVTNFTKLEEVLIITDKK